MASVRDDAKSSTNQVDAWTQQTENVEKSMTCQKAGCDELSQGYDYCDIHSCHMCHDRPAVIQFKNEQGFCPACYDESGVALSRERGNMYPVIRFNETLPHGGPS